MLPDLTSLSILGQLIQTFGVISTALLFNLLFRVLPRAYFRWWVRAWLALSLALVALQIAFRWPELAWLTYGYFFGEYLFAIFLWLGFVNFPRGKYPYWSRLRWLLPKAILWSAVLQVYGNDFSAQFRVHAITFSFSLIPAWIALLNMKLPIRYPWVKLLALFSLSLLILTFFANGLLLFSAEFLGETLANNYSAYQSIFDLIIEVMLAFSLLTIAAVNMKATLERANQLLQTERDNMALLAHQDSLTTCFNRHALSELKKRLRQRHGVVMMIDIDNLKPINDMHGHNVGDQAICCIARTLKESMRAHDYLFRYGGDEFVLVCFDLPPAEAEKRMQSIREQLNVLSEQDKLTYSVSWGIATFTSEHNFDSAILTADKAMYDRKAETHQHH